MYLLILDSDILGFTYPQLSEGTEAQDESLHKLHCGRIDNCMADSVSLFTGEKAFSCSFSDEPLATN